MQFCEIREPSFSGFTVATKTADSITFNEVASIYERVSQVNYHLNKLTPMAKKAEVGVLIGLPTPAKIKLIPVILGH